MFDLNEKVINLLLNGLLDTIIMAFSSCLLGFLFGLPLGFLLYLTNKHNLLTNKFWHNLLSFVVNIGRAIPFIILLVWMIPFTRAIVGTAIGLKAAIIPLTVAVIPFIARMVENALMELPKGLIETAESLGANKWQIVSRVLFPESVPAILNALIITLITLVAYSAMAGAVGAGGLGQIAMQYGYVGYKKEIMNAVLLLLIILVFVIQTIGNFLVRKTQHK